jgi:hypothetical protein
MSKINGLVVDSETQQPLSFANVYIFGTNIGTATNIDGKFVINIPEKFREHTLEVSHVGYRTEKIPINTIENNYVKVLIEEDKFQIDPIQVTAERMDRDAKKIVKECIEATRKNIEKKPANMTGFYREYVKQNNDFINFTESVVDIYKAPYYSNDKDQARLIKGRQSGNISEPLTRGMNLLGGPLNTLENDILKHNFSFINQFDLDYYKYSFEKLTRYKGKSIYIINFKPKEMKIDDHELTYQAENRYDFTSPLYQGSLYIMKDSKALVGADFKLPEDRLKFASDWFIIDKPKKVKTIIEEASFKVRYKEYNRVWNFNNSRGKLKVRVNDKNIGLTYPYELYTEFIVTDYSTAHVEKFESQEMVGRYEVFEKKIGHYDKEFWKDYNIIFPEDMIINAGSNNVGYKNDGEIIKEKLNQFSARNKKEKCYIHLLKNKFIPEDTLWFKAYIVDDNFHYLSDYSKTLYTGIMDFEGNVITQKRFIINDGLCNGQFKISKVKNGHYLFYAYSSSLKNHTPEMVYTQPIKVMNKPGDNVFLDLDFLDKAYVPNESFRIKIHSYFYDNNRVQPGTKTGLNKRPNSNGKIQYQILSGNRVLRRGTLETGKDGICRSNLVLGEIYHSLNKGKDLAIRLIARIKGEAVELVKSIPLKEPRIDLSFFPESGDLIDGLKSKVAFKAIDQHGLPYDFSGVIIDKKGNNVADIATTYKGMGSFNILPDIQSQYSVKITEPIQIEGVFELPKVKNEGINIKLLEQTKQSCKFALASNHEGDVTYRIIFRSTGKVYKIVDGTFQKHDTVSIDTRNMPAGVGQLTLLGNLGIPVAERLVFLNKHKKLDVEVYTNKETYKPHEKVKLRILVKDEYGHPASGNFSISVVDSSLINSGINSRSILSGLLINKALKGNVPTPEFYFSNHPNADKALDLVMLTNGWRRFSVKEAMNGGLKLMPVNKDLISGKVLDGGKEVRDQDVLVFDYNSFDPIDTVQTNKIGNFHFDKHKIKEETSQLVFSVMDSEKEKQGNIEIKFKRDHEFLDKLSQYVKKDIPITKAINHFETDKNTTDIRHLYGSNIYETNNNAINSGREKMEGEKADYYQIKDISISVLDSVKLAVNSPLIYPSKGYVYIDADSKFDSEVQTLYPALFVINQQPVSFNYHKIDELISPKMIKNIRVKENDIINEYYGKRCKGGAIFINTRKTIENLKPQKYFKSPDGLNVVKLYDTRREFYSPDIKSNQYGFESGNRNTIYWNPNVNVPNTGKKTITFYNGNCNVKVQGIIQGIGENYLLGVDKFSFTVKEDSLQK